jgi:hypothetical protein
MSDVLEQYDRQMEKLRRQIEPFLVNLEPAQSGEWKITTFEVKRDLAAMRCWRDGRPVPPGKYTRLSGPKGLFMSDTPAEMNDARELLWNADGHVLITGLGLGMIPRMLFNEKTLEWGLTTGLVHTVTIIEIEEDVIKLVAPSLEGLPVEIIHVDAFEWEPPKGTKFDWAWHDIWPEMCRDNLPEYAKLRRKYGRFMSQGGRQLCWAEDVIKEHDRRYG